MILNGIKKSIATAVVVLIATASFAQMTSGKVVFHRKMNLKKMFKDNPRVQPFLDDDVTWNIDSFALYFNDSLSAFVPIESDEVERGMMKMLTPQNSTYKNLNQNERVVMMNMMGSAMTVKDTLKPRVWKVTESKRKIAGYICRKSMLEINDSTRLYAWFTVDLVPSIGPEGFDGLPGAILGFANEDGSIVYFAKRVEAMEPPLEVLIPKVKEKDAYKEEELKALLLEKMGKWIKKEDLDAQFAWI
ncbi:MAG: GLPGLI family protein [Crocinitomicaceae bacterium]|nr:GLPGLI family protein [Flavobacteriales bacterium]NQZ37705.1 GLPGLI family protein [Crocinitomicaceae bacterium]